MAEALTFAEAEMAASARPRKPGKEKEPEQVAPNPARATPTSTLYHTAIVVLALVLGFVLGLSFFPVVVDSPRDYGLHHSSRDQRDNAHVVSDTPADSTAPPAAVDPTPPTKSETPYRNKDRLLTKEELQQYDGSDESKPVYLAILGKVFDVSRGKRHYGKGGGYSFFAGRDGTRAFVSGNFTDGGLIEDVTGVEDLLGIEEWLSFYRKDYTYVGKLIGHFYDEEGRPTEAMKQYKRDLKVAKVKKLDEEEERKVFPPCNSHWAQGKGGTVWCSNERSGHVEYSSATVAKSFCVSS